MGWNVDWGFVVQIATVVVLFLGLFGIAQQIEKVCEELRSARLSWEMERSAEHVAAKLRAEAKSGP